MRWLYRLVIYLMICTLAGGAFAVFYAVRKQPAATLVFKAPLDQPLTETILAGRLKVLRKRFRLGFYRVERQGDELLVRVRSPLDPKPLAEMLGKTLATELRLVAELPATGAVSIGEDQVILYENRLFTSTSRIGEDVIRRVGYVARKAPELVLRRFKSVRYQTKAIARKPMITLELLPDDRERFARLTEANIGKRLAIVLNGEVITAPQIQEPLRDGRASICGIPTREVAEELAGLMQLGALDAPLVLLEIRREAK